MSHFSPEALFLLRRGQGRDRFLLERRRLRELRLAQVALLYRYELADGLRRGWCRRIAEKVGCTVPTASRDVAALKRQAVQAEAQALPCPFCQCSRHPSPAGALPVPQPNASGTSEGH